MTISGSYTPDAYTGNASTTEFPVTYPFFGTSTDAEIEVIERTIATGAEATLVNGTDYTVAGGSGSTGTVTATTAPAATVQWIIRRTTTETQETDYVENDPFPAESHEAALDRLTLVAQEATEASSRALQFPVSYTGGASNSFPEPSASTVIQWNAAADALESGPTTTEISNAESNATAAAASAVAAAASETAAGVSEAAAASYASPVTETFADTVGFTAGTSTTITLAATVVEDAVIITFDGVTQHHDTYSISGTTVTFTSTIPVGVLAIEASYGTRSTGAIDNIIIGANTPAAGSFTTVNGVTPATAQYTTTLDTKLGGIEALADVTDATNVTAAGALMDSELTSIASVKALNQGLATTDSPSFVNVTANLTGNASGTAATVTGAAQAAITSLGTLTTLTVDDITVNGNAISSGGLSALTIDALAGQAVTVEGVSFDGGLVTNVTSINTVAAATAQYTTAEESKLAAIEASADVTDSTNVLAALVGQEVVATGFTGTLDGILGGGTPAAATVTTLTASGDVAINTDTLLVDVSTETIGVKMTPDVLGAPLQIKHDGTVAYLGLDGGNSDTAPFLSTWQDPDPASALFGWSFFNRSTDGNLRLSRRNNSTTDTEVLTIARSDGAATFAGTLSAGATTITGNLLDGTDNTHTLGGASNRWSEVFSGNGTINTSDERDKQDVAGLTADEQAAAAAIKAAIKTYRWKDAVAEKGDDARTHVGVMAQEVIRIMTDNNLDPFKYSFVCYDEWDEETAQVQTNAGETVSVQKQQQVVVTSTVTEDYEDIIDGVLHIKQREVEVSEPQFEAVPLVDDQGQPVMDGDAQRIWQKPVMETVTVEEPAEPIWETVVTKEAGNRYGVRYSQLLMFIVGAL